MKEKVGTHRFPAALMVCFLTLLVGFNNLTRDNDSDDPDQFQKEADQSGNDSLASNPVYSVLHHPEGPLELRPNQIDEETLWLARAIFSETKRPEEQLLVAWVIRNRVETGYRGKSSYREVVLDPYQFSAFHRGTAKRSFYTGLNATSDLSGWKMALRIAYDVRHLDESDRPFSLMTRHFYSERSMTSRKSPAWAEGRDPVALDGIAEIDAARFRFFEGIS